MSTAEPVTYQNYLRIDELLSLQRPLSEPPHPDELHFIVVHQALELWFKLMLHDLGQTIARIDDDDWVAALLLMRRVNQVMDTGIDQMRSLQDMPAGAFQQFRALLGTASGLQSVQFRELELVSGLREEGYLQALLDFSGAPELPEPLAGRLAGPSLAGAHQRAAARRGITDWGEFYAAGGRRDAFFLLCEALLDYDERWARWRTEHILLVERALGARARGTGGTNAGYLAHSTRYRFFPYLWQAREALTARAGGTVSSGR